MIFVKTKTSLVSFTSTQTCLYDQKPRLRLLGVEYAYVQNVALQYTWAYSTTAGWIVT